MKFVLALAFVLTTFVPAFSQTPTTKTSGAISLRELVADLDSLRSDPAFQSKMVQLAKVMIATFELSPQAVINDPLPDFALTDLEGYTLTNKDLLGKVVLLHLWDPNFPVKPEVINQLNELQETYRDEDVVFLSLTAIPSEYLADHGIKVPLDFRHLPAAYSLIRQISVIPQNILVDRRGIIRYHTGSLKDLFVEQTTLDVPTIRRQLNSLLIE
ncbi:TlpA family protein disulfide reductase [Flavilitoribacter nigricans]|nr:TlpA disulfide reductase family protein [Flavilitoribacter nigricans]